MSTKFSYVKTHEIDIGKWGGWCVVNKAKYDEVYEIVSYRYSSVLRDGGSLASTEYLSREKFLKLGLQ